MLRASLLVALTCIVAIGCASSDMPPRERAVQEQVVGDRIQSWSRIFNNRDRDSLETFYEDNMQVTLATPAGDRYQGWDQVSQSLQNFYQSITRVNLVLQDVAVDVITRDVAVTTFRHSTDIILVSTDRDLYSGQGTLVWVRDAASDTWRIRVQIMSRMGG